MSFAGNLLWFIFGGFLLGTVWVLAGLLWCVTIIGIPFGIACFRIASFAYFPFGKELIPAELIGEKAVFGSGLFNVLWCLLSGLWLAIFHAITGLLQFVSIIGIPFGLAHFKLAGASFAPLGKRIVSSAVAKAAREAHAKAIVEAAQQARQ